MHLVRTIPLIEVHPGLFVFHCNALQSRGNQAAAGPGRGRAVMNAKCAEDLSLAPSAGLRGGGLGSLC